MPNAPSWIIQPGGASREAKDGGFIFPMHLDAAFVSEFYPYWKTEGISFLLVPFVDQKVKPEPKPEPLPTRGESPAKALHARFFKLPLFWRWLEGTGEVEIENENQAKELFKGKYGIESCSGITQDELEGYVSEFNEWLSKRGNHD